MSIDLKELRSLPVGEKLRLVELLWDDIGASDEPIVLHPWQVTEASGRSAELKSDPSIAIDRDELWRAASMANQLRFHPLVADDLKAATAWYDDISPTLGDRFRGAVEQRFDSVTLFPESFAIVFAEVRAARVSRFPYLLLFELVSDAVQVLGVFHTASDPSKWRGRQN